MYTTGECNVYNINRRVQTINSPRCAKPAAHTNEKAPEARTPGIVSPRNLNFSLGRRRIKLLLGVEVVPHLVGQHGAVGAGGVEVPRPAGGHRRLDLRLDHAAVQPFAPPLA